MPGVWALLFSNCSRLSPPSGGPFERRSLRVEAGPESLLPPARNTAPARGDAPGTDAVLEQLTHHCRANLKSRESWRRTWCAQNRREVSHRSWSHRHRSQRFPTISKRALQPLGHLSVLVKSTVYGPVAEPETSNCVRPSNVLRSLTANRHVGARKRLAQYSPVW